MEVKSEKIIVLKMSEEEAERLLVLLGRTEDLTDALDKFKNTIYDKIRTEINGKPELKL